MQSYSIFLRNTDRAAGGRPQLLAYDVHDRQEAQSIVSGIASAYPDRGFNPATRVHWFRFDGSVHEIYTWAHS